MKNKEEVRENKSDKYNKEKDFVKKIGKDSIKIISGCKINEKNWKENLKINLKNNTNNKNRVLPPIEPKDEKI